MQARAVAAGELVLRAVRQRQLDVIEHRLVAGTAPAGNGEDIHEHEVMMAAAPEMKRLERYERRAWSRLKRAMRDLVELKYEHARAPKL